MNRIPHALAMQAKKSSIANPRTWLCWQSCFVGIVGNRSATTYWLCWGRSKYLQAPSKMMTASAFGASGLWNLMNVSAFRASDRRNLMNVLSFGASDLWKLMNVSAFRTSGLWTLMNVSAVGLSGHSNSLNVSAFGLPCAIAWGCCLGREMNRIPHAMAMQAPKNPA